LTKKAKSSRRAKTMKKSSRIMSFATPAQGK